MYKRTEKEDSHVKESYKGFSIAGDGRVTQRNGMKLRGNVKAIKWLTVTKGMVEVKGHGGKV